MPLRLLLALAALTAGALPAQARADCEPVAMVLEVPAPDMVWASAQGSDARVALRPGSLILPGSRIGFHPDAPRPSLTLRLRPDSEKVTELPSRRDRRRGERVFEGTCSGAARGTAEDMLSLIWDAGKAAFFPPGLQADAEYMGPERGGPAEDRTAADLVFKRLPAERLFLEADEPDLHAAWSGRPAHLVLREPASGREIGRSRLDTYGRTSLDLPGGLAPGTRLVLALEAEDGTRGETREIEIVAPGSAPPAMAGAGPPDGDRARAWLYYAGPPAWRLHALSGLARQRSESFVALKVWRDAVTGAER